MSIFIAIQNTYDTLELALFNDTNIIGKRADDKRNASRSFIPLLDDLLHTNNYCLQDLSFIAVNQGPGPFSSLRVVIASANGLHFASNIPLIGIDGLKAMVTEFQNAQYPNTTILLNAFNFDIYFARQTPNQKLITGYKKIDLFLQELRNHTPNTPIRFLGNATEMYRDKIQNIFGTYAIIPEPLTTHCSIKQIGLLGLKRWHAQESLSDQLLPLYLKKHPVQEKI